MFQVTLAEVRLDPCLLPCRCTNPRLEVSYIFWNATLNNRLTNSTKFLTWAICYDVLRSSFSMLLFSIRFSSRFLAAKKKIVVASPRPKRPSAPRRSAIPCRQSWLHFSSEVPPLFVNHDSRLWQNHIQICFLKCVNRVHPTLSKSCATLCMFWLLT